MDDPDDGNRLWGVCVFKGKLAIISFFFFFKLQDLNRTRQDDENRGAGQMLSEEEATVRPHWEKGGGRWSLWRAMDTLGFKAQSDTHLVRITYLNRNSRKSV